MARILRGWHPDPFGVHELRYFTFDGNATRLVRDGEAWSHDAPPAAPFGSVVREYASVRRAGHFPNMLSNVEAPVAASQRNGRSASAVHEAPPLVPTHGWQGERSRPHDGVREIYITKLAAGSQMPEPEPAQTLAAASARAWLLQHPKIRRILRYCSVSVVSTAIGLTVLGVLVGVFGWPAVWANVMGTVIALIPSFELSRRWVWAHDGRRSILRQAAPYAAVSFAGLIVSSIAVHLAANATTNSTRLVHTVAVELANIAAYGSLWVLQFVVCDRILFRSRAKPTGGDAWNGATGSILSSEVMV